MDFRMEVAFPIYDSLELAIIQSATIDWVLQERDSKDLYIVSFKSYREFNKNTAKIASHDTQGLSESWAFDEYLKQKGIAKQIMGVKMLYLIKGARKETKRGSGIKEQNSPLIRAYRKLEEDGPVYAHSWFTPKPENDSGWGVIGRAYERIDVFNGVGLVELGGVKGWIDKLETGEVQPEAGDVLAKSLVEPKAYMRSQDDIDSWLRQTKSQEEEIGHRLAVGIGLEPGSKEHEVYMDVMFPQNRASCHYYPGYENDCPYINICHGTDEERTNLLENYVARTPHHKAELVQLQGVK